MTEQERHQKKRQRWKEQVDAKIALANETRGVFIVITGNGKGKTTAGFGMVTRCIGHHQKAGVAQFIKGTWDNGERNLLEPMGVEFSVMGTGFTWETQNRETDIIAAKEVWVQAKRMLSNPALDVVLLDELTYMLSYDYLDENEVCDAIANRPYEQSVVVTGRGAVAKLRDMADTVSEIKNEKHAFEAGIKARKGVDW
jgi:cob(I)alamin adenosyltransferase